MSSEGWLIVLAVAEILMGIVLFWVGAKASKIDKLEDALTHKAEALVKARFELAAADFKGLIVKLETVVDGMAKRLERGDRVFEKQDEAQRAMELTMERREGKLRNEILLQFATRQELNAMEQDMRKMERIVVQFEEHLKGHGGGGR